MVARALQCKQNKTQKKGGTIFFNHQKEIVSIKKIFLPTHNRLLFDLVRFSRILFPNYLYYTIFSEKVKNFY